MPSSIDEEKRALRRVMRERLAGLSPEELHRSDDALFARFLALSQVEEARTVFAFWGVPGREPETEGLVKELAARGKRVGLPRMLPGRGMEVRLYDPARPLAAAPFGLLEPDEACPVLNKEEIDLALVPALCYDRRGYRLGFGGGYYDRWLKDFSGRTVGLCRAALLLDRAPVEGHDIRVDLVLTEKESLSGR